MTAGFYSKVLDEVIKDVHAWGGEESLKHLIIHAWRELFTVGQTSDLLSEDVIGLVMMRGDWTNVERLKMLDLLDQAVPQHAGTWRHWRTQVEAWRSTKFAGR